ncbi:MAG: hypothetical protein E7158_00325 [Firmicutes bacterium]|nr:hypothetical protein [Bacillota bacterium]
MIKVIAFDMVGVLVKEKAKALNDIEDKIERKFGDILSDQDFINECMPIIKDENIIINTAKDICNKLYEIKDYNIFKNIKKMYPNIKICIATNHVSYINEFISNNMDISNVDNIFISAEINKVKPNKDFFLYILNHYNINPSELLFLDDSDRNIIGASNLGINSIKVNKETSMLTEIENIIKK